MAGSKWCWEKERDTMAESLSPICLKAEKILGLIIW